MEKNEVTDLVNEIRWDAFSDEELDVIADALEGLSLAGRQQMAAVLVEQIMQSLKNRGSEH